MGGGALGGGTPGLPHDRRVGVPEQQLGEVGLLEDLAALVHHGAGGEDTEGGRRWKEGGGGVHKQRLLPHTSCFLFGY